MGHRKEEGESEDTPMFEFRLGCRFASVFLPRYFSHSLFLALYLLYCLRPLLVHQAIRQTFDLAGESLVLQ